ncbi:hypothetical protein HYQ21_gp089 [Acinetobacter phage vB_AbaM_Apostate]|uniref:Uncharacterized protein n=3 Tax=Lazarusvirus TaxID=2842820 RepID=A0A6B9J4G5_9CAUD|nr:hypothetical protein HYQ20_gp094 [Acinetobacter phage vB_AbaM_Berthold]YP_009886366.1 hypothetical protein HYQ21_gp089 [Acinetobacter phage vB_AbaM_Apostate]YP_009886865.1 hypothetical protein HYQ23_gp092 [Acinetobacter phage vB_AbaM_Lazarus]UJH94883.1 hypothetical protein PhaR5_148 [Acinetobacter phage PhaR5]WBF78901.1 hypothetical protein ADLP2_094 [Acinetobacter phage vB_AbaM_DLP2]QGZ15435.1 hypothetical protein Berthold_094 [Acinetobacter phage vB_AbaM_Berthold]QGZ15680.1 hypothetical 
MIQQSKLQFNTAAPVIDTRSTRSLDAKITLGILALEFKDDNIKLVIDPRDRETNKRKVVEIERIVHRFQGTPITGGSLNTLTNEILPIAVTMYSVV